MEKERPIKSSEDESFTRSNKGDAGGWEEHRKTAERLRTEKENSRQAEYNNEAPIVMGAEGLIGESVKNDTEFPFADSIKEYIDNRDESDIPFVFEREELRDFYLRLSMPREPEFSFWDRYLFKRKEYKSYINEKKYLYDLADKEYEAGKEDLDKKAIIPRRLANMLIKIIHHPNYTLAIHKSYRIHGENYENDPILYEIMRDGLWNDGDLMSISGSPRSNPALGRAVRFIYSPIEMKSHLTDRYKGSTGGVILVFPNKFINPYDVDADKEGMENEIYNHDESGRSIIKPEFIIGFVSNLGAGSVCKFVSREEILNHKKT